MNENPGFRIWITTLLINLLWVVIVFALLDEGQMFTYFNSDTLYLPSIYRDLFTDGSGFGGWHLNAAPNFFPDMPAFFIFQALTGDFRLAMLLFSITQYIFLLILMSLLIRQVAAGISWYHLSAANLVMLVVLFVTVFSGDFVFTFYILSISYHMGAFIMALVCLVLTARYFSGGGARYLYLLIVCGFLAVLSNRLFIVVFVLPVTASLPFLLTREQGRRIPGLIIAILLVTLSGIIAFNYIKTSGYLHFFGTQGKIFNFDNIAGSFNVMTGQHLRYLELMDFRGVTVLLSLVSFILTAVIAGMHVRKIYRVKREGGHYKELTGAFHTIFSSLFFLIVLFMPVINGSYVGWAILRYNIYAFYLALFNYSYIAFYFISKRSEAARVFNRTVLVIVIAMSGFTFYHAANTGIFNGISLLLNYYPGFVECTDEFARENDLKYGVAGYWYAKMTTMFSKNGVRLYTVHPDMAIWYHVMNRNWYYKNGKGAHACPEFRFVVAGSLDSAAIENYLGEPLKEHLCKGSEKILEFPEFVFDPVTRRPFYPSEKEQ